MNSHSHDHVSRVDAPCLLHGTVGVSLAIVLQILGLFKSGDDRLMAALIDPVFHGQAPEGVSLLVQVMVCAVLCYSIAFVVLDTAGLWRRVVMGVSVLVLVLAMVPSLAVWHIYFSPFLTLVGVFWAWFFTLMYANHHLMPCEVTHTHPPIQKPQIARPVISQDSPRRVEPVPEVSEDESKKYQPKVEVKETENKTVKEKFNG
jgi:hypothetical protein